MHPTTSPTITQMLVTSHQDDLVRSLRDARRGRTTSRRHVLRRSHSEAR